MATIFSKIINREIPSFIIDENDDFIAILDIMPLRMGHVLIIPKIEVDKVYELPNTYQAAMMIFAARSAKAIEAAFRSRVGYCIIGIEVPHAHLHLVPISNANDINFNQPKLDLSSEQLREVQELIISKLS